MGEKKQILLIFGLLIVLVLVWVIVLNPPKKSKEETAASGGEHGVEFKVLLDLAEEYETHMGSLAGLSYQEDRDPFSLQKGHKEERGEKTASEIFKTFTLKGILWDSHKPLAIVNGEVVREGQVIEGVKIKRIEPNCVVLEAKGEEKILFIEDVKVEKENRKIKMEGENGEKTAPVGVY